jgi:hypothetical protein
VCEETVLGDWRETPEPIARDYQSHSMATVEEAALTVERAAQNRLWELGGPGAVIQNRGLARRIADAQYQSHQAMRAKTGARKPAKEVQRRAARGRVPLTVCVGRRLRRLPEHVLRFNAPDLLEYYGDNIVWVGSDGCGTIFADTNEPRLPKLYCPRCARKAGNTMNAGLVKNALHRLRAARKQVVQEI